MPNLRIVSDNAVARALSLTASSTAGALVAANMLTDIKGDVWRSTGTNATLTAIWAAGESISCVALPHTNLTQSATVRVRVSSAAAVSSPAATNLCTYSEGTVAQLGVAAGVVDAPASIPGFTQSIYFGNGSGTDRYAYKQCVVTTAQTATFSFVMQMDDGSVPVPSASNSSGSFCVVFGSAIASSPQVTSLGAGQYRVSATMVGTQASASNFGPIKYAAQSGPGFKVTGYQVEIGSAATPYIITGSTPVTRPAGTATPPTTFDYDSGVVPACPAAPIKIRGWGAMASGVNAYAFGGGAAARRWFPVVQNAKWVIVDISDPGNPAGYVESSCFVTGQHWSPAYNADVGASMTPKDESTHTRTDASDLMTSIGTRSREMSLTLSNMHEIDRAALISIVRGNGKAVPLLFSLFPEAPVPELERDHEMYCKLSDISAMTIQYFDGYSAPLVLDEA